MAIFHFSIKIGSRGKGQSAIAAAAYRSGTKLMNEELLQASDYTRKGGIIHSEIALCAYAPTEYANRETLWNAVHKIEKQKNAQLWREFEAALPVELGHDEHIQIVRNFVKRLTEQGMCVDWSIHDTGKGNPHVHMMCTMRSILPDGTWAAKSKKIYELDAEGNKIFQKIDKLGHKQYKTHKESFNNWDSKDRIKEWRIAWEQAVNAFLPEALHIDHRSYAEQGIDKISTIHEGYGARGRERSGKLSDRCEYNRQTRLQNQLLSEIKELESQMFTVVNTVNHCKQRFEEERVVSESATPEVLPSENSTELCNISCNTLCYNTCDTENEEDKAKSHEIWQGVVQAREKFCRVYQLYKESEVLKKLKDKMGDVGKMQEVIQNYENDLQRIAELEQEIQGYGIWHPKKAAQLKLIKIQNKLPDEKLIKQYQKVVSTHQAINQRLSELWAYKKSSAESALHTFVDVYKKIQEAGLVEQAEQALLEFAVPVFMSEYKKLAGAETSVSVKGSVSVGAEFYIKYYVEKKVSYLEMKFSFKSSIDLKVEGSAEVFVPLAVVGFATPVPGLFVELKPSVKFTFSVTGEIKGEWTASVGTRCTIQDKKPKFENISEKPKFTASAKIEGTFYFGIDPKPEVCLINEKLLSIGIDGGVGVEVVGTLEKSVDTDMEYDVSKIETFHACKNCVDGDINFKCNVDFSVTVFGKKFSTEKKQDEENQSDTDKETQEEKDKDKSQNDDVEPDKNNKTKTTFSLFEYKKKIGDFYWSWDYDEFDFTECPHNVHKVSIVFTDTAGKPLEGVKATFEKPVTLVTSAVTFKQVTELTSDADGTVTFWAEKGNHNFTYSLEKYEESTKTFKLELNKNDEPKQKSMTVKVYPVRYTAEITVQDTDGNPVPYAYIKDSAENFCTNSGKTGKVSMRIPNGSYHADVTARGYDSASLDIKIQDADFSAVMTLTKNGDTVPDTTEPTTEPTSENSEEPTTELNSEPPEETTEDSSEENSEEPTIDPNREVLYSGKWGDNLTWALDSKGLLTISGNGEMSDFSSASTDAWRSYKSRIKKISIEQGVTSIGYSAFAECTSLTEITIPDNVTSIDYRAFSFCTSLIEIIIPSSVTSIGIDAFSYTPWLKAKQAENPLVIASGILIDGTTCEDEKIVIPDDVTSIGRQAFYKCTNLTEITIPDSVTSIGDYAFNRCRNLTEITIPDSVTSIGIYAFYDCESLTKITIPDSVINIGAYAFSGTSWLETKRAENPLVIVNGILIDGVICEGAVVIPNSVTSIGGYAFWTCTKLTEITISDSVTSIGDCAFEYCENLTKITISNSVTSIGYGTFYDCESLTKITIPDSVTSIGDSAFYCCKSLTEITIPDSVTSIGNTAFSSTSLTDVYYTGTEEQWESISIGWYNEKLTNSTIHYNSTASQVIEVQAESFNAPLSLASVTSTQYTDLIPETLYNFYVMRDREAEIPFSMDNLLYIAQGTSSSTGTLSFSYVPLDEDENAVVFAVPMERSISESYIYLPEQVYDGTEFAVQPVIQYNGKTLAEGTDYVLSGDTVVDELGAHYLTITGQGDYTGYLNTVYYVAASEEISLGDVNGDGKVNASDAAEVLKAAALIGTGDAAGGLTEEQFTRGDVNHDESVNASDAAKILVYAAQIGAGQITLSPEEYFNQST